MSLLDPSIAAANRGTPASQARVGIVAIGRNEGERLRRCLASLRGPSPLVYVDSGSTDGSQDAARAAGAELVELDPSVPFTAARARNLGCAALTAAHPDAPRVVVGDGPYRASDIQATFDHPVITHLPHDPGAAGQLLDGRGGRSTLSRSRLARAVTDLGSDLEALVVEREPVVVP